MIDSPRALFQKSCKEEMKLLALALSEAWFKKAVIYAQAQMTADNTDKTKLEGANLLLTKLTELSEEIPPEVGGLPDKSGLASYS